MINLNPKVDAFLSRSLKWQEEMTLLRALVLDCGLTEDIKWGKPCYLRSDANVAIITPFKEFCILGFFKGALIQDAAGLLVAPGENSQTMRQLRFTNVKQIEDIVPLIKSYIFEAIEIEKAGLKVEFKNTDEYPVPVELQLKFDEMPEFKKAFDALTPGRKRAYLLFFASAKQSATRTLRIEKYVEQIFRGKGMND